MVKARARAHVQRWYAWHEPQLRATTISVHNARHCFFYSVASHFRRHHDIRRATSMSPSAGAISSPRQQAIHEERLPPMV